EKLLLVAGKQLLVAQAIFAGSRRKLADGHDDDIVPSQIGFLEGFVQVPQPAGIADGDKNAARLRLQGCRADFGLVIQIEFFELGGMIELLAGVDVLRDEEQRVENDSERDAVNGGDLLREQVRNGHQKQDGSSGGQPEGNFQAAEGDVPREFVLLIVALVAQDQHPERFESETPYHAERVSFPQQEHVAATGDDGCHLEQGHQVQDAIGCSETAMRAPEPVEQHPILSHAVHDAVHADKGSVHRARQNQDADDHHKDVERELQDGGSREVLDYSADEVVVVVRANRVRDDHDCQDGDDAGTNQAISADDVCSQPQILEFGIRDFAIHLGERFESAHGQDRVAERDDQDDEGNLGPEGSAEPAGRFFRQVDVRRRRRRRQRSPTAQNQRQRTPDQEDNDHHGGDLHDAQSLGARFGDALDVRPPEVNRHRDAEEYGEGIWVRAPGLMESFADLVKQPPQILAGADDADRAGEDVIHDQRGYGQLGDGRSHAVAHNHVYAAAHEHAGAFQVHRADSVAEQHHGQYHPGRGLADGLLGDASDVVHRGGHVVEHDGG